MRFLEDHGEHYCGSRIYYDPEQDIHLCAGMHDDPDLVIEPGECPACDDELDECCLGKEVL